MSLGLELRKTSDKLLLLLRKTPEDLCLLISSLLPPRGTGIAVYTRAPFSKTPVFTNVITFVVNIFYSHVVSFNNRLQIGAQL
jgi:hypothetical protein